MFSQIGPLEIVLVLAIALIVLGPKRLPEAGRSVGRGIRNFKSAIGGGDDDEPARVEPARVEPAHVEPARIEPARVEPTDSSRST